MTRKDFESNQAMRSLMWKFVRSSCFVFAEKDMKEVRTDETKNQKPTKPRTIAARESWTYVIYGVLELLHLHLLPNARALGVHAVALSPYLFEL